MWKSNVMMTIWLMLTILSKELTFFGLKFHVLKASLYSEIILQWVKFRLLWARVTLILPIILLNSFGTRGRLHDENVLIVWPFHISPGTKFPSQSSVETLRIQHNIASATVRSAERQAKIYKMNSAIEVSPKLAKSNHAEDKSRKSDQSLKCWGNFVFLREEKHMKDFPGEREPELWRETCHF